MTPEINFLDNPTQPDLDQIVMSQNLTPIRLKIHALISKKLFDGPREKLGLMKKVLSKILESNIS